MTEEEHLEEMRERQEWSDRCEAAKAHEEATVQKTVIIERLDVLEREATRSDDADPPLNFIIARIQLWRTTDCGGQE